MRAIPLPEPQLVDDVVALRPWLAADIPAIVSWREDPEIIRWTGVPADQTEETALAYMHRAEAGRRAGHMLALAIADAGSGSVLGSCDVRRPDPIDPAIGELGYLLDPEARRRGAATRAMWLLTDWSFRALGMERIQAMVHPENPASARVLERLGFQREGLLRSYRAEPGGREDRIVYAVLPGELTGRA